MKGQVDPKAARPQERETSRLIALSDGLFATVLTLLVLDLRMPAEGTSAGVTIASYIHWLGPHFFSYAMTFLVAGTFWLSHHNDFAHIVRQDRGLMGYNLLFLLSVGLFPFSTATIGLGGLQAGEFPFFWALYASNVILAGVMLDLTWIYALSHGLATEEITPERGRYIAIRQGITPVVFFLSIGVAYLFPSDFLAPYFLFLIPLAIWGVDRYFAVASRHLWRLSRSELLWRAGTILPWILILALAIWAMTR